jgi:hypothetical protein
MDGNRVFFPVHVPGTLAANLGITFTAPCDLTLVEVQACGSNANNAQLKVGHSGDDDAYLALFDIGDSSTLVQKKLLGDFIGSQYPHISKGTVVVFTLDYDGSSGTAAQNFIMLAVFTEG